MLCFVSALIHHRKLNVVRIHSEQFTSTAREAPDELCRTWKSRVLAAWDCPPLRDVPPLWIIMGLPLKRLMR